MMISVVALIASLINHCIIDGAKTTPMRHHLNQGALLSYDPIEKKLKHHGTDFYVLTGSTENISRISVASIGEQPDGREIIVLDPKNAPRLLSKYQELVSLLENAACTSQKEALTIIADFIKYRVFASEKCQQLNMERFINQWIVAHWEDPRSFTHAKDGEKIPVIPLDDFIEEGIGMCRHVSFVAAFFLDKILKSPDLKHLLPNGTVYHVRDQILDGGHSWNLYIPEDRSHIWHFDSFWDVIADLSLIDEKVSLYFEYGRRCIETELRRFYRHG